MLPVRTQEWQIVAAKASLGASATVEGISKIIGQGVDTVQRVAAQYGITLVNAINPVLAAAGFKQINLPSGVNNGTNLPYGNTAPQVVKRADGGIEDHVAQIAPASGATTRVWA